MASSGMLRHVALVRTDVSEELSASFIRTARIGEQIHFVFLCSMRQLLVTANIVTSSPFIVTLKKEALSSSETSVLTRATWHNIPEDAILQNYIYIYIYYLHVLISLFIYPLKFHKIRIHHYIIVTAAGGTSTHSY
jgi:hypothetical protein